MTELFEHYHEEAVKTGDYSNALLVGNNLFHKHPSDDALFSKYVQMLFEYYEKENREIAILEHIQAVISTYSENAVISDETIATIRRYESTANMLTERTREEREAKKRESLKEIIAANDEALKRAGEAIDDMRIVSSEEEFHRILDKIRTIDLGFDSNHFVDRQRAKYDEITKISTELIEKKMKFFERQKNIEYNKRAVESYGNVYRLFKDFSGDYTNGQIRELFEYDPARLFNETIVYYNHVYNFMLSKLPDEAKFEVTKLAIMCEKK
ncbi:MAG: hypothetical protein HUK20_12980 [Fibrobacter sp.]|nr:hypothetical protein [Fibrobacter sp.]